MPQIELTIFLFTLAIPLLNFPIPLTALLTSTLLSPISSAHSSQKDYSKEPMSFPWSASLENIFHCLQDDVQRALWSGSCFPALMSGLAPCYAAATLSYFKFPEWSTSASFTHHSFPLEDPFSQPNPFTWLSPTTPSDFSLEAIFCERIFLTVPPPPWIRWLHMLCQSILCWPPNPYILIVYLSLLGPL